jgi:(1->4)-alpha-D-glucan 1-alpha-D-glucosylmutase
MNERHKQACDGARAPSRNDEYMLYQTLVGVTPFDARMQDFVSLRQRVKDFMLKAVREAKAHTDWMQPNEPYENACLGFVDRILDPSPGNPFWADFVTFQKEISECGLYNSLSQLVLKMTSPGLPDFYQGTELWDFNLVDPDNRRRVDFEKRRRFLGTIQQSWTSDFEFRGKSLAADAQFHDGRIKLFVIQRGLRARRENRDLFEKGDYLPASAAGRHADHIVAFFRRWQDRYALTMAPRFLTSLIRPGESPSGPQVWGDTRIVLPTDGPPSWQDVITGNVLTAQRELPVGEIVGEFPVSILISQT